MKFVLYLVVLQHRYKAYLLNICFNKLGKRNEMREVESGKWQVASGKWQVASGKWQVASEK